MSMNDRTRRLLTGDTGTSNTARVWFGKDAMLAALGDAKVPVEVDNEYSVKLDQDSE